MKSAKLTSVVSSAILIVLGLASAVSAQDNSSYPLVLSTSNLDAMVQGRLLTSPVKAEKQNSIENIIVSYEATKGNAPVELNVDMTYSNGKVDVIVDSNLLAKIKGQPVVFEITQRPVTEVVLKYDAPPASDPIISGVVEGAVFVRLSDTKRMAGKVEGLTEFKLKTAFGEVTVPMSEIAGIKFHTSSDDKAVVIMNNGDSVTGIPDITAVELTTDWGKADIDPEFIQSITSTSGAKFRQDNTDFGVRWILNTGNSLAPGALRN
ncbi:hypothetical protein [Mariniblastus fucicola]|uniref:Uncharacterized protein n=1 Tax=Mariniblastus fucicola TaxID=980251 RepID=A0A5B9P6F4_9BACT|nr:hypothetical protein [Mariniblastus fucicola]QEG21119.1 hypothetical protein MFFC18_09730 [Mariniblastus fucicola]